MKKRGKLILSSLFFAIFLISLVSAVCTLEVSLVNQDPYPAVQGDTVRILFQVSGVQDSSCNGASFQLDPGYSFTLNSQDMKVRSLSGGTFTQGKSEWNIPYTLQVNRDAFDGDAEVTVLYSAGSTLSVSPISKNFDIRIQDSHADFEIDVKDYNPLTKIITFEISNIANIDTTLLKLNIPEQENIEIKGSNVNIVGDLDSQEYTTADFEATPKDGEIFIIISYTDQAGVRRTIQKSTTYDSKYFEGRAGENGGSSTVTWVIILVIIGLIAFWFYRRHQKKKLIAERRKHLK
ncbi:hypothetical protein COU58_00085 [Candidatus Pacearchaeota archaeon CG10_big_fil_rev_8_21_14_0_10_32_42]|nr:MAG: hypothetical protein COU58_00085 [Candidatus Pacearchaeota archaeon CG10_big_fil_rev_8_21_14_0_10_32_42]